MENKTGLRPCPFCGGYARLVRCYNGWVTEHPTYMVVCDKCTAQGLKTKDPEIAVKAWNRRVEPETAHGAPENRVLTMEELCECVYADDWSFVWLEDKGILATEQICAWRMTSKYFVFAYVGATEDEAKKELTEENGKEWRCWLRKPTAEEMANMPWEE